MPTTARPSRPASAAAKRHAAQIVKGLKRAFPDARCALNFQNPLQLLVATILSAQCTDTRVNIVTKDLLGKYRQARDYAEAQPAELEKAIQSTGFFRNKAKNLRACAAELVAEHHGEVPRQMDALVKLAGVGRKTANVVLGTAFGIPTGVVVDTHVTRVSRRLGLTRHADPVKIERDLMALLPASEWIDFSHRVIALGRQICVARKPKCDLCPLADICPKIGVARSRPATGKRSRRPLVKPAALGRRGVS